MTPSVETLLSELVSQTRHEDIPERARDAALLQVLDTVGVTLAAAGEPAGSAMTRVLGRLGGNPQARMLGTSMATSTVNAAWANGSMAHLLDYDDAGFSHPSACIMPAAMAIGEEADTDGPAFLDAMVLGYEVFERLSLSARENEPRIRIRGFHPTSIYGSLAAAAAAGRLLALDAREMAIAFGIAATDASGLTQQFGTWAKGLNAGNAARTGVLAALLAKDGFWGDESGISGPYGLFSAIHDAGHYDFGRVGEELGQRWAIVDPGLAIKVYPCCGINRRSVDGILRMAEHEAYDPAAVERIIVHVHPHVFHTLRFRAPEDGFRGKFSLDYTAASAALDRKLTIDSFSDESARRPELRRMLERIELREHPEWDMDHWREIPVDIILTDGTVLSESIQAVRGTKGCPLTRDEVVAKYLECAGRVLPADRAGTSVDAIWSLAGASSLREVVGSLVP